VIDGLPATKKVLAMSTNELLSDFIEQGEFARQNGACDRTVARYRQEGLPWLKFGGKILIGPADEARAWLLRRVRRTGGAAA
jgi:hypothetical protein